MTPADLPLRRVQNAKFDPSGSTIIGGRSVVRAEGVEVGAERTILTAEDVKLCFTS